MTAWYTHAARAMLAVGLIWALAAAPALAHGLLISVRGDGKSVSGTLYYSNGKPGAGEWVEMFDQAQPAAKPQAMATLADGSFRFQGIAGHSYRIVASGEEGHSVESRIVLGEQTRGQFVDTDPTAPPKPGFRLPPAWALLGGVLELSILPALWLRRRRTIPVPQDQDSIPPQAGNQ